MSSITNDTVWNEDADDGFVYEDEIEIVSLLDHPDASSPAAVGRSNNNKGTGNQAKTTTPRIHPVGLCAIIVSFLLLASILLSRSSSLPPEIKTPCVIAIDENIDGSGVVSNNENGNEKEIHQPPSSSTNNSNVNPKTGEDGESEEDAIEWFELHTGNSRIDRAYRLAMDELHQNIEHNNDAYGHGYFVTGAGGDRSRTRHTAYAIELAGGLIQPDVSRRSLESCTEVASIWARDQELSATVWHQEEDVGSYFGGWPNLSDAIVGARGAWHLYLYTGNSTMLEWAYETTVRSLLRAELEALRNENGAFFEGGLFGGSSSFMGSNSGYPKKYKDNGELVRKTKALSTNILYYNGYHYAYKMGTILMENNQIVNSLKERSKSLKKTIRERLWIEEKGLYAYFEDENGVLVEKTEGLGVVLALLSDDFESEHRIQMLFENVHRTELGIPSLWPRFDDNDDLTSGQDHNGRIWPFVSGYFAIAAARHRYPDIFAEEMANLIHLSEEENTFKEFYELDKSSEKHRSRQLCSDAGYLGMVYKGLFGMDFQKGAIEFAPSKVEGKDGVLKTNETMSLLNVKYRRAILDIHVTGFGTNVTSFKLNGQVQELPKMDAYVIGRQLIEIVVAPSKS